MVTCFRRQKKPGYPIVSTIDATGTSILLASLNRIVRSFLLESYSVPTVFMLNRTRRALHVARIGDIICQNKVFVDTAKLNICVEIGFFFDRASLCNLSQMKPTTCTLLLGIFISTSVHVSGKYVPIIRRTNCIYATLVFSTLYGWLSGLLVGMKNHPKTATHTE